MSRAKVTNYEIRYIYCITNQKSTKDVIIVDLKELGDRYKNLRLSIEEKNPISIKKLSELIGILPPRISELENGKRDMSLTELKAYHKYFKVSFEYLLGETDVSSANEDVKIACKVTGLNENAINNIIKINSFKTGKGEELANNCSIIIGNDLFPELIERVMYYVITKIKIELNQEHDDFVRHIDNQFENLEKYLQSTQNTEAEQSFDEIKRFVYSNLFATLDQQNLILAQYKAEQVFKSLLENVSSNEINAFKKIVEVFKNAEHNPTQE